MRSYREGRGLPARVKVLTISVLWATIGYSVFYVVGILWVRAVLITIAIRVTIHILSIRTCKRGEPGSV